MRATFLALLPLGLLLAAAPAVAQTYVGLLGGPSFSRLSSPDVPDELDMSTRTGYGLGAVLGRELRDDLSLELQPVFITKGAKFSSEGETVSLHLSYVEVPLLLKFSRRGPGLRPYVLGGPVLGFRKSATLEASGLSLDFSREVKDTDFGLALGAGVKVPAGRAAVLLEGRYALGLRNIYVADPGDDPEVVKNRGFQFQAGFTLPIGR
jgi:outer membrane protein with beta-barrel domain